MKILFKVFFVFLLVFLGSFIYQRGFHTGQMWMENPPTIKTNCWSICIDEESVSWEEYVRRYHESKMRLDQPGGGE